MIPVLHIVSCLPFAATPAPPPVPPDAEEIVVRMASVSVFDEKSGSDFVSGLNVGCDTEPSEVVTGYPELTSASPLFGSGTFPGVPTEEGGTASFHWVLDESGGTGTGYDRLYLDRDRDLELTDEEPLKRLESPPRAAIDTWDSVEQQACFERLELPCDFGEAGSKPVEVMPRLTISRYGEDVYRNFEFMGTHVWKGTFEIGETTYVVHLGHDRSAVQRFDGAGTALSLATKGRRNSRVYWWGGDRLNSMHELDGTLYTFTATPTGETLTVRPYSGAFGEFAIGAGERQLEKMNVQGSLRSAEHSVAVGSGSSSGWPEPVEMTRLPVGKYYPYYLTVQFGELSIQISNNYHADGSPREGTADTVFGIEIREDRPFSLDFGNEPKVLFASPAKDLRLKPGDTLEVAGVLIDPVLDVMIRGLDDSSEQVDETLEFNDGETHTYQKARSLDPRVIITRKGGEKIAEGDMPFG